ncbi:MAG: hypothetical protein H5T32_07345 [Candidatus Methanosuratus sp.]|nr:hypothetical protein [Candidatus Methanosuratincola sp.]
MKDENDRIGILALLAAGAVRHSELVYLCKHRALDGYIDFLEAYRYLNDDFVIQYCQKIS